MALQTHSSQDVTVEQAFAERDWSATPLGSRARWPESLKTALSIAMQSRFPIIIFWGPELVQLYNQAYRPILGDKHPRALGQTARDCFPEIWDSIGPMLHGVLESGRATWSEDLMLPLVRDGHPGEYYFTFSYSPITDATGVAGVFCAVQETTAAVVARRDAERRTRELVELNRAKDAFLTNISHEFRTPLALMLAPLAQAATAIGDGPARSDIDVASRNALRLQRLVDSLLAYSRIEAGRLEPRFVRVDLCEFTRDLVASFESLAAEAGLALSIACESHADVAVDRDMWERIVFNLMSNAIKYTLDGGIDVSMRVDDATFMLRVADTGIGVKREHRERIFERFYRAHTEGRSAEGAGIGLALARDLVHLHGGTIDLEDAPGGGSIFTVRIPRRSGVHAVAVEDEATTSSAPQYLAEAAGWLDAAPVLDASSDGAAHVLVVDDNADVRNFLVRLLAPRYRVSLARDGVEALAVIERDAPDVVLSDVMMPRMDGRELLERLRARANGQDIAVIFLSARAGAEATAEGLDAGADDYVAKPFTAGELIARIEAQLRLQQARRIADRKAAENTASFRSLAEILPAMVWTADNDGSRTFANAAWRAYTGVDGSSWEPAIHPNDLDTFMRAWNDATRKRDGTFALDYRLWNVDANRYRWVTARAQRIALGSENVWVGTTIDIDERKRREMANEFLVRAGALLNQTLNIDDTFSQLAMLAVQTMCDYCVFYLMHEGRVHRAVWLHRDPQMQAVLDQAIEAGPDPNDPNWVVARAIGDRAPFLWNRGQTMPRSYDTSAHYDEIVGELDISSVLTCPVYVGSNVLGALALARCGDREHFDEIDLETIAQLADRAAIALANANLFEREHNIAVSFQSAALPDAISTRDGIDVDAHYVAARREARVGGDWYDTELLPDGRLLISIGDVSGSGLEAAVVMSMVRTAIRSVAHVYADPATILEAAQGATERRLRDHFATVFIGVLDPVLGRFTYASAGHTRPLLLVDGSTIEIVAEGLPIGTFFEEPRTSETIELPEHATLILYTDGLIEGAGEFLPGEEALRTFVQSPAFRERPTARGLYEGMLPEGGSDDVAILIARISLPDAASSAIRIPLQIRNGEEAARARDAICDALRDDALIDGEALENARLVIGELTANVSRHAPGAALAAIDRWGKHPVFHLVDQGLGFRYSNRLPPIFAESGRGLFIASALSRRLEVLPDLDGGSHVIAVLDA